MSMTAEELRTMNDASQEAEDNGFVDLADNDVSEQPDASQIQAAIDELTDHQKLALLEEIVIKHPLNREIMYRTLAACAQERPERQLEEEIASFPEFRSCTQNQYRMICMLVEGQGLRRIERNEDEFEIFPEEKEGLTEDEVDDLVCSVSYELTPIGREFVRIHSPKARLVELLDLNPERNSTYIKVLDFISQQPRSYNEIRELLKDSPALETLINDRYVAMQPSVFVDKLERNGALVWNNGWTLTKDGEEFLNELKVQQ